MPGDFDLYAAFKVLLDHIRKDVPSSRARELAVERLEESAFWVGAALTGEKSPIDYVDRGYTAATKKPAAPRS